MAIKLKQTKDLHLSGVKICVYGQAGAGKTSLIPTLPNPVIFSVEGGLLSIRGADSIPYVEITSLKEMKDALEWAKSSAEAKSFESIAVDSISEFADVVLAECFKNNADGRAAYGDMIKETSAIIRDFLKINGKHVFMTAKIDKTKDEMGRILYAPLMPGESMSKNLPYIFDELYAMRVEKAQDGSVWRGLLCQPDGLWHAKSRIGSLDAWEAPDLGAIIQKIGGQNV